MNELVAFLRGFRIFNSLRSQAIENIYQKMVTKEYIRGQKVYSQGSIAIDGVYFIQDGEFEVTQRLDSDKTKAEQTMAKKALSRTMNNSQSTRSLFHLQKIDGGTIGARQELNQQSCNVRDSVQTLHMVILGQLEVFGLEEIVGKMVSRMQSVTCLSKIGKCYWLDKD